MVNPDRSPCFPMILQIHIDKLNLSPEILQKVLALQDLPETERYIHLSKIFQDAEKFQAFHSRRRCKAHERAIRWGREYHKYLQKHLALGLREKTAKSAARRDFIAAHPRPKNADDLIRTDEFPGLSTPSLRRYHNAYLNSLTEIVP